MQLHIAIDGYWLDREITFSPATVTRYNRVFDRLQEFLGDVQVEDISSKDIKKFFRHLHHNTDLGDRTIYDHYAVLSSFWTWAAEELEIEHALKGKVEKPRFTKRKIEPVPMADVKKLLRACEYTAAWKGKPRSRTKRATGKRDRAIILVLVDCGLRVQELCDLTFADYDQKRGRLHIKHGKGDKERFVFAGNKTKKAIWRYLATRSNVRPKSPLFSAKSGNKLQRDNVRHMIEGAAKRAGIGHVHPHKLRHTFAIEFLRAGGNLFELKEILGHERLDMVLHYAELAETDIENAARHNSPADRHNL